MGEQMATKLINQEVYGIGEGERVNLGQTFNEVKNIYIQAQTFVNYLLAQPGHVVNAAFREKLMMKDSLKFYNLDFNKQAFKVPVSSNQEESSPKRKCLFTIPYSKLNL
mmetsp:Transcript_15343/g.23630  ORF Transcript_15343/g.23630 Transcript_15343/m.23630 type:complete len:109 (+) Transcript_15343:1267-1593(+)|eukprot:CAMPEP_0170498206 /NCGR_PEP_ID=MMETSP0208-20121228/27150_1 /TAXON_ID=197538 /ORGANISM="Strombidium inclinatum, Strain S3" /LENGTH=108 /DNA_ID=CAMNT_0010775313 /DNA_START=1201 /DNA_END=1527 /DNA_ORIENTATION=-